MNRIENASLALDITRLAIEAAADAAVREVALTGDPLHTEEVAAVARDLGEALAFAGECLRRLGALADEFTAAPTPADHSEQRLDELYRARNMREVAHAF